MTEIPRSTGVKSMGGSAGGSGSGAGGGVGAGAVGGAAGVPSAPPPQPAAAIRSAMRGQGVLFTGFAILWRMGQFYHTPQKLRMRQDRNMESPNGSR